MGYLSPRGRVRDAVPFTLGCAQSREPKPRVVYTSHNICYLSEAYTGSNSEGERSSACTAPAFFSKNELIQVTFIVERTSSHGVFVLLDNESTYPVYIRNVALAAIEAYVQSPFLSGERLTPSCTSGFNNER